MEECRKASRALILAAAVASLLFVAVPCRADGMGDHDEATFLLLGLAVVPVCPVGRAGFLDMLLGLPTLLWGAQPRYNPGLTCVAGPTARLRFTLGRRWLLFARGGAGFLFTIDVTGFHAGPATQWNTYLWPDLQVGAHFRL